MQTRIHMQMLGITGIHHPPIHTVLVVTGQVVHQDMQIQGTLRTPKVRVHRLRPISTKQFLRQMTVLVLQTLSMPMLLVSRTGKTLSVLIVDMSSKQKQTSGRSVRAVDVTAVSTACISYIPWEGMLRIYAWNVNKPMHSSLHVQQHLHSPTTLASSINADGQHRHNLTQTWEVVPHSILCGHLHLSRQLSLVFNNNLCQLHLNLERLEMF